MNNSTKSETKMDGVCKAGAIVTIVSSGFIMFLLFILAIVAFTTKTVIKDPYTGLSVSEAKTATGVTLLIFALIQLLPLLFSIHLLQGKAKSNIPAGVIALIFSGLIGGILILVGKYNTENHVPLNSSSVINNSGNNNQNSNNSQS